MGGKQASTVLGKLETHAFAIVVPLEPIVVETGRGEKGREELGWRSDEGEEEDRGREGGKDEQEAAPRGRHVGMGVDARRARESPETGHLLALRPRGLAHRTPRTSSDYGRQVEAGGAGKWSRCGSGCPEGRRERRNARPGCVWKPSLSSDQKRR